MPDSIQLIHKHDLIPKPHKRPSDLTPKGQSANLSIAPLFNNQDLDISQNAIQTPFFQFVKTAPTMMNLPPGGVYIDIERESQTRQSRNAKTTVTVTCPVPDQSLNILRRGSPTYDR